MADVAITTFDNPNDPFEQFNDWLLCDNDLGYGTPGYLARTSDLIRELTGEDDEDTLTEMAIDDMIKNDFLNIYKKVYRNDSKRKREVAAAT